MSKESDNQTTQNNTLPRKPRCRGLSCPLNDAKDTVATNSYVSAPSPKPRRLKAASAGNVTQQLSCISKSPDVGQRQQKCRKALSQNGKPPSNPYSSSHSSLGNLPASNTGNMRSIPSTGVSTKPFSKVPAPQATPDKANKRIVRQRAFSITDGHANLYPKPSHSPCRPLYPGPTFVNSPAPSTLPTPIFNAWSSVSAPTLARTYPTPTNFMDRFVTPFGENRRTLGPDTYYPRMIASSWDL